MPAACLAPRRPVYALDTPRRFFTRRPDSRAVGRNKTYLKVFVGLYIVGTGLTALVTVGGEPWRVGAVLAVVGTLAVGAVLGGRDWYHSRASASAES